MENDKEPDWNIVGVCPKCAELVRQEWQKEIQGITIKKDDYIKFALTGKEAEHIWGRVIKSFNKNAKFLVAIANDPVCIDLFKLHDEVTVNRDAIEGYISADSTSEESMQKIIEIQERVKAMNHE